MGRLYMVIRTLDKSQPQTAAQRLPYACWRRVSAPPVCPQTNRFRRDQSAQLDRLKNRPRSLAPPRLKLGLSYEIVEPFIGRESSSADLISFQLAARNQIVERWPRDLKATHRIGHCSGGEVDTHFALLTFGATHNVRLTVENNEGRKTLRGESSEKTSEIRNAVRSYGALEAPKGRRLL
jgi:hypothetical protein